MQLTINGDVREAPDNITVQDYLDLRNVLSKMVVVEHNGTIIDRNTYTTTMLTEGDVLEIVQMMAGG